MKGEWKISTKYVEYVTMKRKEEKEAEDFNISIMLILKSFSSDRYNNQNKIKLKY